MWSSLSSLLFVCVFGPPRFMMRPVLFGAGCSAPPADDERGTTRLSLVKGTTRDEAETKRSGPMAKCHDRQTTRDALFGGWCLCCVLGVAFGSGVWYFSWAFRLRVTGSVGFDPQSQRKRLV